MLVACERKGVFGFRHHDLEHSRPVSKRDVLFSVASFKVETLGVIFGHSSFPFGLDAG